MAKKEKINMNLEIAYEFHPKTEHIREHWMYFKAEGATHEECKEKARKHYESQIRSLGWAKITTLKEIRPIGRTNDPAIRKTNSDLSGSRAPSKPTTRKTRRSKPKGKSKG